MRKRVTLAVARLVAALRGFAVLGIETNIPFLIGILEHPRFRRGDVDTAFLDEATGEILASSSSAGGAGHGRGRDRRSSRRRRR